MSSQRQTRLTPAQYLAIERKSEIKHEYFAGEMFEMVGASRRHNLIAPSIIRLLGNQLLDGPCTLYPSDMRVKVSATGKYAYPEVVVACAEEQFDDEEKDTLLNPINEWRYSDYRLAENVVEINVIGCELVLQNVYAQVW